MKHKPRDGVIICNGLKADFRFIRYYMGSDRIFRVDTAVGEAWAHANDLHWDSAPPLPLTPKTPELKDRSGRSSRSRAKQSKQ